MMHTEERDLLAGWAVYWWWIIAGPGNAAWRAGFYVAITEYPRRLLLVRQALS